MYQQREYPSGRAPPRNNHRTSAYSQASHRTSYRQDFVELSNLPNNVRVAGSPESFGNLHEESDSGEHRNLIRNDPSQFAVLDRELPSHVKQSHPAAQTNYAQLQHSLPSHVKPASTPQMTPQQMTPQFAAPSQNFNAMGYKTTMPVKRKRERSCFGLCLCSGKVCVIFTTVASLVLALALFFLWMRRPGFAPASEIIFNGDPFTLSNDTMSIFHSEIVYSVRITNSNFYPLRLIRMPAKVYDSATGSVIGGGEIKNVFIPALGESYANLTLVLDFRASSPQDKTWQDIVAACPLTSETETRVPLTTRTQIMAYFDLFQWAGFIPKDSFQRNLLCK